SSSMKFTGWFFLIWALILGQHSFGQSGPEVSQQLLPYLQAESDSMIAVVVVLREQVNVIELQKELENKPANWQERAARIVSALQEIAASSQPEILERLSDLPTQRIRRLWSPNAIALQTNSSGLQELSTWAELAYLLPDSKVALETYRDEPDLPLDPAEIAGIQLGLKKINAPALWNLGYTGYGRTALVIDSGVDGEHPALADRYRGNMDSPAEGWFDLNGGTIYPNYCNDHGTHVLGTIVGLDPNDDDTVGVAWGARWMGAPAICDGVSSDNLAAFQWALDPDGDPSTYDLPDVINNSWRAIDVPDECTDALYLPALEALEMAGIAVVFSAGNSGPDSASITAPKNINQSLTNTFTVAALNGNAPILNILGFSSRGPSVCAAEDTSSLAIKPEVAAPGFQIRSTETNGTYGIKSGTSMAAPHASGAILLLKEAFPQLSGTQLKEALYYTCLDLGDPGEDNEYGMGMIDVFAAFQWLQDQGNVPVEVSDEYDGGILGVEGLPTLTCPAAFSPLVIVENRGQQPLTSFRLSWEINDGSSEFVEISNQLLLPDSQLSVSLPLLTLPPGSYEFRLSLSDLNAGEADYFFLDNAWTAQFELLDAQLSGETELAICDSSDALLAVDASIPGEVYWFDDPNGNQPIGTGQSWWLPAPVATGTYYGALFPERKMGMEVNAPFPTSTTNDFSDYLRFDVQKPCTLQAVTVQSFTDGYRTITLSDEEGQLMLSQAVFLNLGEHRIVLDWELPPGRQWRLGLADAGQLQQHDQGARYPYIVPGVLQITGSSAGMDAYPYFYDWEISYESPCDRIAVTVSMSPGAMEADFSFQADTTPGLIYFTDQSIGATEWWWDFGDGHTSTEANPSHSYVEAGTYEVFLRVNGMDDCSEAIQQSVFVAAGAPTAILEPEPIQLLRIYPNPSPGLFQLTWQQVPPVEVSFQLFDLQGAELSLISRLIGGPNSYQLDLQDLAVGMYLLQVATPSVRNSSPTLQTYRLVRVP
ncbi:MAG: S8 family serine peptidase, partial [Bacteroidota bacterium]